jgi:glutamate-1-semialdehyde aminotransferase
MESNQTNRLSGNWFDISAGANKSLGSFESGEGAVITDHEGREYINFDLSEPSAQTQELKMKGDRFIASLTAITNLYPVKINPKEHGFSLFFHKRHPESFTDLVEYDADNAAWFYRSLLKEGVRFNSSLAGANYIPTGHTVQQLRLVLIGVQRALSFVYGYVDNM